MRNMSMGWLEPLYEALDGIAKVGHYRRAERLLWLLW